MQRYFSNLKKFDQFILNDDDTYHINTVMRSKIGEVLEIIYQEKLYLSEIIILKPNVIVKIIKEINSYNELSKQVTICQSLVKENKMDLILQKSTELGCYEFIPLIVKNSIIKGDKTDFLKKVDRWQKIVIGASQQSKRNIIPIVKPVINISELIKLNYDLKILLTVNETSTSFKKVLQNNLNCDTIIIVIGPEGGFTKEEENTLINNGYISTSLGNLILRTETASLTSLSMINYELEVTK